MARAATEDGEVRCTWHDTLVENFGKSGNNGKLGNSLIAISKLRKEMEAMQKVQNSVNVKIAILTSGGSLVGGGIVALITKLLS